MWFSWNHCWTVNFKPCKEIWNLCNQTTVKLKPKPSKDCNSFRNSAMMLQMASLKPRLRTQSFWRTSQSRSNNTRRWWATRLTSKTNWRLNSVTLKNPWRCCALTSKPSSKPTSLPCSPSRKCSSRLSMTYSHKRWALPPDHQGERTIWPSRDTILACSWDRELKARTPLEIWKGKFQHWPLTSISK